MKLWEKIADLYIKETTNDGQKFCGCREEDCELYHNHKKCIKCLKRHIEESEAIDEKGGGEE